MIKYNKTIIALLIGAMSVVGAASLAAAAPAGGMGRGGPRPIGPASRLTCAK